MKSRIFRAVICLVLICCLCVNMLPRQAEALALETALGVGFTAIMIAAAVGIVFHPRTQQDIVAIGQSFQNSMYQWGTEAKKLNEVETFFNALRVYSSPDGDDDPDTPNDHKIALARTILAGIAAWMCAIVFDIVKINAGEEAPEGYAYYNGHKLPTIPDDLLNSYTWLVRSTETQYYAYVPGDDAHCFRADSSDGKVYVDSDPSDFSIPSFTKPYHYASIVTDPPSWPDATDRQLGLNWGQYSIGISLDSIIWTNTDLYYDDGTLALAASDPLTQEEDYFEASAYVGDIPEQIQSGEITPDTLPMPEFIDYELAFNYGADLATAISNITNGMTNGEITFDDYKSIIGNAPVVEPDPTVPPDTSEDPDVDPDPSIGSDDLSSPVGNVSGLTFFDKLLAIVTEPFKWIWNKIETFFTKALAPELWLDPLQDIVMAPAKWIWENIESFFAPLLDPEFERAPFEWIWNKLEPILEEITDAVTDAASEVKEAVQSLVVPEEDYLTAKVEALCAEFAFADSIVKTAQAMQTGLAGVTTEPPVIYINLGATRGSYNIGGTVPFLDLRWYAEYKPTVDAIISAFLWICFVWRMLLKLPGIISGMPGDFTMVSAHAMGLSDMLPSRSAEYEQLRMERRESMRKGRS